MKMTVKQSVLDAGRISAGNSKMPGSTFAISALHCKVGGKLAKVKGSVCDRCYAIKLQKLRPSVNQGWTANYEKAVGLIDKAPNKWIDACVFQINRHFAKSQQPYHRWFDSGDLQSVAMLKAICGVAERTPDISHWLPTREAKIVKDYLAGGGVVPSNLVIRISATMIGDKPVKGYANTSTVHRKEEALTGKECLAYRTDTTRGLVSEEEFKAARKAKDKSYDFGHCGDCRACWSFDVENVSYPLH